MKFHQINTLQFLPVAAAIVTLALSASEATAKGMPKDAETQPISGVVQSEPTGSAQPADAAEAAPLSYPGHGPYICSASGFGERSKCVLRTSLKARRR